MPYRWVVLLAVCGTASGCTHKQLTESTVNTASTIMEVHYRSVLANLAMLSCQPETLPNHIRLGEGVVQINDEIGMGNAGGFTSVAETAFGIDRIGPNGSRRVSEQWGTDAVGDPLDVKALQDIYRHALGLPPLPDTEAITYLKRAIEQGELTGKSSDSNGDSRDDPGDVSLVQAEDEKSEDRQKSGRIPVEIYLRDVPPPGWLCLGSKWEVPHDAAYVGRWGKHYAWVMPEGVPALSRLTLTILTVLKVDPAGKERGGGLAFTGS